MIKEDDGVWTATTDPLPPGFHYYYLMIDGYRFADPASETFFGVGRRMSGIIQDFLHKKMSFNKFCLFNYATKETGGYADFD